MNLKNSLLLFVFALASIAAADEPSRLIENQPMSLKTVGAVLLALASFAVWLNSQFQGVRGEASKAKYEALQTKMHVQDVEKHVEFQLKAVLRSLDSLPCPGRRRGAPVCPPLNSNDSTQ